MDSGNTSRAGVSTAAMGESVPRRPHLENRLGGGKDGAPMAHVQQLIARNSRRARKRLGLSQAQVAERCGCSDSFVSEVERGRKYPSAEALERIAEALNLRPYQLLLEEEDWELRDRMDTVTSMYRDLKSGLLSVLDDAMRRHLK